MQDSRIVREIDIVSRIGHHLSEQSVQQMMQEDPQFEAYVSRLYDILSSEYDRLSSQLS